MVLCFQSLGCILFALCYGASPFDEVAEKGGSIALAVMSDIKWPTSPIYSDDLTTIIRAMLQRRLSTVRVNCRLVKVICAG